MFNKILEKVNLFDTIIIHRHSKPDGDALGSQIGLKEVLKENFPGKDIYVVGDNPGRYGFIGSMDEVSDDKYTNALVFVLDCGAEKLISDERYKKGKYLIKIDHHIPQGEYGDIMYVDTFAESCAGFIAYSVLDAGLVMTTKAATALMTGMITDSGRFRYSSTTVKTFETAARLLQYDVNTDEIYSKIYVDKLSNVKLKAKMIDKFVVLDSGAAYLINTKEEIKEYNVPIFDISRGMVGTMAGIEEISVWANFCEDTNGDIYCEFRSAGKNVNQIAVKYGGGGHLQASGCTVKSFETVKEIIKDMEKVARGEECTKNS